MSDSFILFQKSLETEGRLYYLKLSKVSENLQEGTEILPRIHIKIWAYGRPHQVPTHEDTL